MPKDHRATPAMRTLAPPILNRQEGTQAQQSECTTDRAVHTEQETEQETESYSTSMGLQV